MACAPHVRSILFSLVLGACGRAEAKSHGSRPPPVVVELTAAREESLATMYRASGTVRGFTTAVMTSKTTGYVRSVDVRAGDHVRAGQLLAVLEANDAVATARRARAGVEESVEARAEAENALGASQASLRLAKATYERDAELYASRAIARQELDEAEAAFDRAAADTQVAAARVRGSRTRIDQANAAVGEAQATLDYSKISAPFAGWIIERAVDPGDLATPGAKLVVVEDEGKPRVEVSAEESRAASIHLGDSATVEVDSLGSAVPGTVGEIVPAVDVGSRAFVVKVDLPPTVTGLRPGMFARVSFDVGKRARLVVPTTAITSRGELDRVFVADDGRLRLRMITRGEAQGDVSEILSGLAPGERVVSVITPAVRDGAPYAEAP